MTIRSHTTVQDNFSWYIDNQGELIKKYNNKHLVIVDKDVVKTFDDKALAYFYGVENFGLGNFCLQFCTKGDTAYTVTFYTPMVSF
ncbi:MAG: hypothetical protein WAT79_11810 [Saprospiraceae bacterium]